MTPIQRSLPFLLLTGLAAPTAAQTEDRDNHAPVASGWAHDLSAQDVKDLVNTGKRLVDIEVVQLNTTPSVPSFTVAWVDNIGPLQKKAWWTYGATANALTTLINLHKARVVDIEAYETSVGIRFAALLEDNTGANSKGWAWYAGASFNFLKQTATTNKQRIVDLEAYDNGRGTVYAAVLLDAVGADDIPHYSYLGINAQTLANYMSLTSARPWDIDRVGNGLYNVVTVQASRQQVWHDFGLSASQVDARLSQLGARLIDVEKHLTLVGPRYDVVMVNTVDSLSRQVGDQMRQATDGATGTFLERILPAGRTHLAGINHEQTFEPAHNLAALHLLAACKDINDQVWSPNYSIKLQFQTTMLSRCPIASAPQSVNLTLALSRMMEGGKNEYARYMTDRYGTGGLNSLASAVGMKDTKVNHVLGCESPANTTTLSDLGRLYAAVAHFYVGSAKKDFLDAHKDEFYGSYYANGRLQKLIDLQAALVGLSSAQKDSFIKLTQLACKAGAYTINGKHHRSWFAYLRMPCYTNLGLTWREYSTGAFVNDASDANQARDAVDIGASAVLSQEILLCMKSLKDHVFALKQQFGSACKGNLPTAFTHSVEGTPNLGALVSYKAYAQRPNSRPAMMFIGVSKNQWLGAPLPLQLSFMGAPQCFAHISLDIAVPAATTQGLAELKFTMPTDKSLLGKTVFTQYFISDPGANPADLTTSNAVESRVGGQK